MTKSLTAASVTAYGFPYGFVTLSFHFMYYNSRAVLLKSVGTMLRFYCKFL